MFAQFGTEAGGGSREPPAGSCSPSEQDLHHPGPAARSARRTYREISPGRQPLGEMIEGIGLGAHGVAAPMHLVEQMGRLVEPVIADVHVLLLHSLGSPYGSKHC